MFSFLFKIFINKFKEILSCYFNLNSKINQLRNQAKENSKKMNNND